MKKKSSIKWDKMIKEKLRNEPRLASLNAEDLVKKYFPFIVGKAKMYENISIGNSSYLRFEDFVSVGNEAVLRALNKYDVKKCNKFMTFVALYITGYMKHAINSSQPMRSHGVYELSKLNKAVKQLNEQGIENPSEEDISIVMGGTVKNVKRILYNSSIRHKSLDSLMSRDGNQTFGDTLAGLCSDPKQDIKDPPENLFDNVVKELGLSPRDEYIIRGTGDGRTLESLGKSLKISRERVRQLLGRVKTRMLSERLYVPNGKETKIVKYSKNKKNEGGQRQDERGATISKEILDERFDKLMNKLKRLPTAKELRSVGMYIQMMRLSQKRPYASYLSGRNLDIRFSRPERNSNGNGSSNGHKNYQQLWHLAERVA